MYLYIECKFKLFIIHASLNFGLMDLCTIWHFDQCHGIKRTQFLLPGQNWQIK